MIERGSDESFFAALIGACVCLGVSIIAAANGSAYVATVFAIPVVVYLAVAVVGGISGLASVVVEVSQKYFGGKA